MTEEKNATLVKQLIEEEQGQAGGSYDKLLEEQRELMKSINKKQQKSQTCSANFR